MCFMVWVMLSSGSCIESAWCVTFPEEVNLDYALAIFPDAIRIQAFFEISRKEYNDYSGLKYDHNVYITEGFS